MSRNKRTSVSLFQFMNLLIVRLLKNVQYLTMQHYKATLNSFMRFRNNKDIRAKIPPPLVNFFVSSNLLKFQFVVQYLHVSNAQECQKN